jgi:hypothetical protein
MALALRFTCDEPGCRAFLHTGYDYDGADWGAYDPDADGVSDGGWIDGCWDLSRTEWRYDVEAGRWLCPTHARAIDAPTAAEA